MKRYLEQNILKDLKKKMVFIVGPRQVGKTYLARSLEKQFKRPVYLNYDDPEQALIIKKRQWPLDADLIILDEIHKMKKWKNFIKGVYDTKPKNLSILVTGSARLDIYKRSGESLAGRYYQYRLNPFTLNELSGKNDSFTILRKLNELGGFPEPYLSGSVEEASRWRKQYFTDIIREDVFDISRIHDIKTLQMLVELLRSRVGAPLSYLSIARDLQISPHTVKNYIELLENLFIIFLVRPFHKNIARAVLKEPKIYFYDSAFIDGDEGKKLENTAALSLKKHIQYLEDTKGKNIKLSYLRTKNGQEIDFSVIEDNKIKMLIEVKLSDSEVSRHFKYFEKYAANADAVQLVQNLRNKKQAGNVKVVPASEWLAGLE